MDKKSVIKGVGMKDTLIASVYTKLKALPLGNFSNANNFK
jgi:hypothetical protein